MGDEWGHEGIFLVGLPASSVRAAGQLAWAFRSRLFSVLSGVCRQSCSVSHCSVRR